MAPKRAAKRHNIVKDNNYNNLSLSDVLCPICRTILIEPVTLPCNHGFCLSCFDGTMANTNLVCPLCRIRIGSWLRACKKENKLINSLLWKAIQKYFPQQVKNKLEGVDETFEEEVPRRITSQPGEIRREYELQKAREEEQLRKQREEEAKASELLIQKIQEEEELEKSILEEKLKADEQIAKRLAEELSFDPGPSTSKAKASTIEEQKDTKKLGPLDTFLRNMANKQLSVSLKSLPDGFYRKKEFTTKILCQDSNKQKSHNIQDSMTLQRLNKVVNERQIFDVSDTITSECRYFKPIDQKRIPPSQNVQTVRVPAVSASPVTVVVGPPNGHVAFRHNFGESPFVLLRVCPRTPDKQIECNLYPSDLNSDKKRRCTNTEEESQITPKKAKVDITARQTRSMTKAANTDLTPTKRYRRKTKDEEESSSCKKKRKGKSDEGSMSPFLGFDKHFNDSLPKSRNGVKDLTVIFDSLRPEKKETDAAKNVCEEIVSQDGNVYKNGDQILSEEERNNGMTLQSIELIVGARCLRSDSYKQKLQEEEDLKLARKLHEELNSVRYSTRNSITQVAKKFPMPRRRQITLYNFLEK